MEWRPNLKKMQGPMLEEEETEKAKHKQNKSRIDFLGSFKVMTRWLLDGFQVA